MVAASADAVSAPMHATGFENFASEKRLHTHRNRSIIRFAKAVERRSKASDQMPGMKPMKSAPSLLMIKPTPALVDLMERSTGAELDGFFCGRNL